MTQLAMIEAEDDGSHSTHLLGRSPRSTNNNYELLLELLTEASLMPLKY